MCHIVSLANALTSVKHFFFSKPSCTLERFSAKIQSFLVDCTYYRHSCLHVCKQKSRCLHFVSRVHLISVFSQSLNWEAKNCTLFLLLLKFLFLMTKKLKHLRLLMQPCKIDTCFLILWISLLLFSLLICYLSISVCVCSFVCKDKNKVECQFKNIVYLCGYLLK